MTLAERVIFERQHGKGSAPVVPESQPQSLEDLRSDILKRNSRLEAQRIELEARKKRAEDETHRIEHLKRMVAEESSINSLPDSQAECHRIEPNLDPVPSQAETPPKSLGLEKQRCVTPAFALKRFFTDWTIVGRSSRSELWWIMLFVQMPLLVLERMVGNSDLVMMVGVVELILLWPFACLEARRFHDIGWSAAVGLTLVLLRYAAAFAAGYYGDTSPYAFGGGLIGFLLLLANVAESRPANKYGPVPNTR